MGINNIYYRSVKNRFSGNLGFHSPPRLSGYVGMDCLSLPLNFAGAANYIYQLTRALLRENRPFALAVICKQQHAVLFEPYLRPGDKVVAVPLRNRAEQLLYYEFRLQDLLIRENVKLFYAAHYICPPPHKNYSIITTFHDMGFYLYPQNYPLIKRLYFKTRMRTFLERSDLAVSVSQSTKKDLLEFFPSCEDKIQVVHPGTDHLLTESPFPQPSQNFDFPFILAVNAFEKRKNIPFIIRVFNYLKEHYHIPHRLFIIGHPGNAYEDIVQMKTKSRFGNDIVIVQSVPTRELILYYKNCDFFINASEYEGFGFTPFEAIHYRKPTFLYRNQVLGELLGNHPSLLPHFDVKEWGKTIGSELASGFKNRFSSRDIGHLVWHQTAKKTLDFMAEFISTREVNLVPQGNLVNS